MNRDLRACSQALRRAIDPIGIPMPNRSFMPHFLTLADHPRRASLVPTLAAVALLAIHRLALPATSDGLITTAQGKTQPDLTTAVATGDASQPSSASRRTRLEGAARWLDAHREQTEEAMRQRDASRTLTDQALLAVLQCRFDADQAAAGCLRDAPAARSSEGPIHPPDWPWAVHSWQRS